ncbi:MAG TPA: response regulator [Pyrinomonadaceae bacterium]|nr:response regulator [Pyrinomonadaceae bacterium]
MKRTPAPNVIEMPLISIVDDDESVRQAVKSLIDSVGFRAEVFQSGEEFLNSPYLLQTDCLIADVRMQGMSGLELQERLSAAGRSIPIVFISAHDDKDARARGLRAGAIDFLQKPFSEDSLLGAISVCLDKS